MSLRPSAEDPSNLQPPGAFPSSPNVSKVDLVTGGKSLSQAVKARKDEYLRKKQVKIKVGTWNVAAISGTEKDLASWFVQGLGVKGLSENAAELAKESSSAGIPEGANIESVTQQEASINHKHPTIPKGDVPAVPGGEDIELYVLGLQEILDIASPSEALKPYTDPGPSKKWKQAMEDALPDYKKVAERQLLGLYIVIYASPALANSISSVSCTSVGTGLMGYMGNKGATSVRLVLGETTKLVFVNCHLAAGSDKAALNRRVWDTNQILSRTRFDPISDGDDEVQDFGDSIGDEDFAFWFGDLNYRLDDIPGDDVRRLLLLHTRNEYDIENKSKRKIDSELGYVNAPSNESLPLESSVPDEDHDFVLDPKSNPASLHTTLQSLLVHDQLRGQQKQRLVLHDGWQEGDINFLPTYKYDVGSVGMFDSGEKKRSPSWCDRVLYRSRSHKLEYEQKVREEEEARKQDADMKARGLDEAASENAVLFDYNPDEDGLAYGDEYDDLEDERHDAELVQTKDEQDDALTIEHYISHQRVLSSDHKPLEAIFSLTYSAVDPELKAKIHQEVARELDKAENECRPSVTVVVDHYPDPDDTRPDADTSTESSDLSSVDFGQVRYGVRKIQGLTIANTGQTSATFGFIDRPVADSQQKGVAPSWLHIDIDRPSKNANANESALKEYQLPPGETAYVTLSVHIRDFETTHQLNTGSIFLEDILVLRIVSGKDHFIPVRGVWMQTCLCRTLDELVRIPEGGIRYIQKRQPQALVNSEAKNGQFDRVPLSQPVQHSAPHELFVLTESIQSLSERSVAEWDMTHETQTPPWKWAEVGAFWPFSKETWTFQDEEQRSKLLVHVRECLDTAQPFEGKLTPITTPLSLLEVLAETLLTFLASLRDGIISETLWAQIEENLVPREKPKANLSDEETQTWVMEVMSTAPVHNVSLTFVMFLLTRILNELAPASKSSTVASPQPSGTSDLSNTSEGHDTTPTSGQPPSSPQVSSPGKIPFLPSLRRRRTDTRSSSNSENSVAALSPATVTSRRSEIIHTYSKIFANVLIRSEKDEVSRAKDRKILEQRKMAVMEALLRAF